MKAFYVYLLKSAIIALIAFPALSQSAIPDMQWSKTMPWYYVNNTRIAITSDGNIYAAGYKFSTTGDTLFYISAPNYAPGATADGGVLGLYVNLTYFPRGDSRIFYTNWGILKKNATGQEVSKQVWYEGYGPGGPMYPSFDGIKKILGTPDNSYIILNAENTPGYSYGSLSKTSASGERLWNIILQHQTGNGSTPVRGETVINTPDGGLLVTGYLPGVIDDPFNADNPSTGWVGKYDAQGNLLWEKLLTSFSFISANRVRSTFAITDACLAADGNGYTLVGSGYAYSSLAQAPPRAVLLELDQNGSLRRSNVYDVDPTPAYVALYTDGDGKKYYMLGNTALGVQNFDYRLLKINTDAVAAENPLLLGIVAQRTFSLSDAYPDRLTDLEVAGDGGLVIAGMTGVIKLRSERQQNSSLAISTPSYDCQTGQLTLNTTGGNSGSIDYQIIGLHGWSGNNTFSVPTYQRQGTTFKIEVRQNGQVISDNFTTSCSTTPPPQPGTLALHQPDYNCETGALTILYSNGDGSSVEYRIIGLRDWGISPSFIVPSYQRQGTAFLLEARTASGKTANLNITLSCGPYNPPNPTPDGLTLAPTFNCNAGILVVTTTGGNGSLVEFKAPGLRDWGLSSQFVIPIYQRNGTTFMIYARQSGQEYSTQYTTACGYAGRTSSAIPEVPLTAVVLSNPVHDNLFTVEVRGAAQQLASFSLTDIAGNQLHTREVGITKPVHQETFSIPSQSNGLYLLRISTQYQSIVIKVLKL